MEDTIIIIISIGSCVSSVLICFCFKHYKNRYTQITQQNRLANIRKNAITRTKVKPIIQMTDEELKDEFEQYHISHPQLVGEQNV